MEVMSNNLLVENPFFGRENNGIHLSDSAKEEMIMNELMKCKQLTIYKAGLTCSKIKDGDKVYIDIDRLMNLSRVTLTVDEKEKDYFIARESDVIIVY